MLSGMKHETTYLREQGPRRALLWYKVVFTLVALAITTAIWLLVSGWKRRDLSDFESVTQAVAVYPMQLRPLISGSDKARVGELVYLTHVFLTRGPTPRVFFVTGSQGTRVLTVAEAAHVTARSGDMVDVRGTIRNTPSLAALRKQWNLGLTDARKISEIPIYIESDFIRESVHANVPRKEYP
jgi:hypothetical protein